MGRSVSFANNAHAVVFRTFVSGEDYDYNEDTGEYINKHSGELADEDDDIVWSYEDLMEDVREHAKSLWPSFKDCDVWVGNEDHAIVENSHAYLGISTYCGLMSVWLVTKANAPYYYCYNDGQPAMAEHWCEQIRDKFAHSMGTHVKVGSMSNGEGVYEKILKE